MENSKKLQRKQTTQYGGHFAEVELEVRGKQKTLSNDLALTKGERVNDVLDDTSNLLERILEWPNVKQAMERVIRNKGSHGVDRMKVDELRGHVYKHWSTLRRKLLEGTYNPSPVRRVEISKPDGGIRNLGVPTVLDRTIQQAIAQGLNYIYNKSFSNNSYGFRPNRSAKMAILKAKEFINEGNTWVVDLDLEKFFDKVNHDILMGKLATRIRDRRLLHLIGKFLKSGIMINGMETITEDGVPQGGPLSPILSNIMLDEVDKELEKRGHKFCRYADDLNIYVGSRKAGERVMNTITSLLENKLKLKVNKDKSAVAMVNKRKFLGFSFYFTKGKAEIRIHEKSYKRLKGKVKEITNRNKGVKMEYRLKKLNEITTGWINYFGVAKGKARIDEIEGWIRRRLRACIWKQWKTISNKKRNLMKLGIEQAKAWEYANTRKGYWRISNSPILNKSLTNSYLESLGFKSISKRYQLIHNS
ncbi:MAG: group II intron reverse transcriptase/maturase [Bacillota bacterium]|nr:group II intron reverse transcriptase/maturase [Bacillota bacterium]